MARVQQGPAQGWQGLGLGRLWGFWFRRVRQGTAPGGQARAADAVLVLVAAELQDGPHLFGHIPAVALLQGLHEEPYSLRLPSLAVSPREEHMSDLPIQVIPGERGHGD